MSNAVKERILSALTPELVYGGDAALKKSGKNLVRPCCFHSENTPSLTIFPDLGFKCFGCGKHGSAFDFVMEMDGVDFREAQARLALMAGVSLKGNRNHPGQKPLTIEELARGKKLPAEFLRSLGLKDTARGVDIPYPLPDGSLAPRHRIRSELSGNKGSYWDNNQGLPVPYGLDKLTEAREAGFVCIPEGESDPWTLWYHGFPALGIPGATMTGKLEASHVAGISKLYIIREPDGGGATFVPGLAMRLKEIGWEGDARAVSLYPFKDPNDLHKSNPETFRENFQKALDTADPLTIETAGVFGILASEVKQRRVEWLWRGRIPLGKITDYSGDPGLGKSATTLDIAARVTTGSSMPGGSPGVSGGVLVLNAEDDEADTIVPRLAAMNADLTRVRILKAIPDKDGERQSEIPGDLAAIERAAKSVDAKLIIIDPLMAFLPGSTNSWKDQDVRRALAPLAALAERLGAAVVIVRHLTKNSAEGNPLYRGGGSIGIVGAARSGLLAASDPDDETGESRIVASTKSNLGRLPPSLRYVIEPRGESIRVRWCGESQHRAATLLTVHVGDEEGTAVEEASEFLRSIFDDGALSAKEVLRKAKADGFSERTIDRAKARLGIKTWRQGFGAGSTWMWDVPPKSANAPSKSANNTDLAPFGKPIESTGFESKTCSKSASSELLALNGECLAPFDPSKSGEKANRPGEIHDGNSGGNHGNRN